MSLLLLLRNGAEAKPEAPNRLRVIEKPPMRQYLIATTPGGHARRWGEDEPEAADVLEELTDSDTAPGGLKDLTAALPRKPGTDYSDMQLGTKLEVFGAGQYKVSEYRLERVPRTSGDYLVVDPAASGFQVLLSDKEEARAIPIDADMTAWGGPTAKLTLANAGNQMNMNCQVELLGAGTSGSTDVAIVHKWAQMNTMRAGGADQGISLYSSGGIEIGRVMLEFAESGMGGGAWFTSLQADTDDSLAGAEVLVNFNGLPSGAVSLAVGAAKYLLLLASYLGAAFVGEGHWEGQYKNIRIFDRSGIPIYGTFPEVGILASDFIAYALSMWAPGIRFTTGPFGSLKPSNFIIPHLTFKEPTTVQEMVTQALRFENLIWGVWPGQFGPTFYLSERGKREGAKRWRTRIRPAKFSETGQQMDQIFNRVVMSWQDTDGTTKTLGPTGSAYRLTDSRCEDLDPENALNEAGVIRTKHLTMNGVATVEGAAETARLFLEKCRLVDGSGEATLTGYVEDEKGAEWPYYCVHADDEIEFIDSSISGPRHIVEATRSRKSRSVNIKIDAPPDSYAAILEELQVRETAAGLGA